jgi:hypothetical protein
MHSQLSLYFDWSIWASPPFSLHLKIKIKCNYMRNYNGEYGLNVLFYHPTKWHFFIVSD